MNNGLGLARAVLAAEEGQCGVLRQDQGACETGDREAEGAAYAQGLQGAAGDGEEDQGAAGVLVEEGHRKRKIV